MLPVSGPFVQSWTAPFRNIQRQVWRQKPPYNLPLKYFYENAFGFTISWDSTGYSSGYVKDASWSLSLDPDYLSKKTYALNQAYARLQGELSDKSGWAENLAQWTKTREGFTNRCIQLGHFAVALKQRRFRDAARILRTPLPSGVSNRKAISQNFLEFEYGIRPILSDMEASWKILCGDPSTRRIRSKATAHYQASSTFRSGNQYNGSFSAEGHSGELWVRMGCDVRVSNPNLFLANRLGLLDLALPWKLIPFSFIVDWFVNVEQCISSLTDWLGVQVEHPYTTVFHRGSHHYDVITWFQYGGETVYSNSQYRHSHVQLDRSDSISFPTLQIKPFQGFSLERGAQAISLVLSVLGK